MPIESILIILFVAIFVAPLTGYGVERLITDFTKAKEEKKTIDKLDDIEKKLNEILLRLEKK